VVPGRTAAPYYSLFSLFPLRGGLTFPRLTDFPEARLWTISQTQRPGLAVSEGITKKRPASKDWRQESELYSCIVYSCGIGSIQLGPDGISLAGHLEFGEEGEGLFQFLPLGLLVTMPRCQRRPLPIAEP
jgi:hypothetical protein